MSPLEARFDRFEELRWTFSNEDRITATLSLYFRGHLLRPIVTVFVRGKARYTQSASGIMLNRVLGFPEEEDTDRCLKKLLKPMIPKEGMLTEENLEPIRSYIETLIRLSKGN
ncbi:hypothetical protein [Turicimonas muris]|uniref:hypothetical protein n=1 Tax=Turicimonas muris TaxID=1796652 RepID=UPI0032B21A4A